MDITEQQISVRLIGYKEKNRWALVYRIRRRAVSSGTACICNSWKIPSKGHKPEANLTHFLKFFQTNVSFYAAEPVYYIEGHGTQEQ